MKRKGPSGQLLRMQSLCISLKIWFPYLQWKSWRFTHVLKTFDPRFVLWSHNGAWCLKLEAVDRLVFLAKNGLKRQLVERVGLCSGGGQFNPRPCHLVHGASCECEWLLYVCGGDRGRWRWMCSHAPISLPQGSCGYFVIYHHQYDCVWMNGTWNHVRHHTNPIHYYYVYYAMHADV